MHKISSVSNNEKRYYRDKMNVWISHENKGEKRIIHKLLHKI